MQEEKNLDLALFEQNELALTSLSEATAITNHREREEPRIRKVGASTISCLVKADGFSMR